MGKTPWRTVRSSPRHPSLVGVSARVARLRRERFDLYIDLRGDVRQLVFIGCLCGARYMLTYRRNGGDFLADWSLPLSEDRHQIEQGCNLVRVLGASSDTPAARIPSVLPNTPPSMTY